jgi:tricorn protease interacting factor F2/3
MNISVDRYTLNLDFLPEIGFIGKCVITIECQDESILLNAKSMKISVVEVRGEQVPFFYDKEKGALKIEGLKPGKQEIKIFYEGQYSESLMGIYKAGSGDERIITSQFESNGASYGFPCLDNPGLKAVFNISVKIKKTLEAISNMPVKETKEEEDHIMVTFEETPKMSTYLLFIGIGKFISKSIKHNNTDLTLSVPGSKLRTDDFPLEVASKCLDFYEGYFGIPYVLPKMHLISIPDFGAGAMENWGAITFREEALLNNSNTDTESRIQIAVTIAHEIAHQWFGNLVTMKWWNDLWLNESFATFMSSLCINSVYPEYEEEKFYYLHETVGSMSSDSLQSSHPINADVKAPEDIEQIFDEISYGKGGSILRMIHHYVGDEDFKLGVSSYLKEFQYSNATGIDLWKHIEKSSGKPVVSIMENWINQSGYPILKVGYSGTKLHLSQSQYFLSSSESDRIWKIPLFVKTKSGEKSFLMDGKEMDIEIKGFIKINSEGKGYYRSSYPPDVLEKLFTNMDKLSSIDLAELVNDTNALFTSGRMKLDDFMKSMENVALKLSTPSIVLINQFILNLNYVIFDSTEFHDRSIKLLNTILDGIRNKTQEDGIFYIIAKKRIEEALAIMDKDFAVHLSKEFNNYFSVIPDKRSAIALAKARVSTDIGDMVEVYKKAEDDSDKVNIINAIGWANGKSNYKRLIKMITNGEVKKQDAPFAIITLIRNPASRGYITGIFTPIIASLKKSFEGTGIASTTMFIAIALLGIHNEKKIRKKVDKLNGEDTKMGVNKGYELLEIYKNLRKKLNLS